MSAQATEQQDLFVKFPLELLELVAAEKLTINAAYLYMLLLTHINYKRGDADVWPSRSSLAKRMRLKNARAVDRYINELVDAGLVEREHRRDGKVNDTNKYTLAVVCWPPAKGEEAAGGSAPQHTRGSALENTRVVCSGTPELDEPQLDESEPDQSTERNSTTSGRCAPSGGDVAQGDARNTEDDSVRDETAGNFWLNDRDAFRRIMGPRIVAEGSAGWPRGVYDTNRIYSELRVRKARRIDRPGSYVAGLLEQEDGRALENWLLREGFETPDGVLG